MRSVFWVRFFFASVVWLLSYLPTLGAQANPFLRPGDLSKKTQPIVRPAPPPPAPKPINSNLELRGFFKFQEVWRFAIFDKVKNKGFWLKKGESFDNGKVQIESFNPDTESIRMKGGQNLTLKSSQHRVMPVPSAQPVKKKIPSSSGKSPIRLPKAGLPRVKIPARTPSGTLRP